MIKTVKGEVFCERAGQIIFNFSNLIKIADKMIPDDAIIGNVRKCTKNDLIEQLNNNVDWFRDLCKDLDPEWYTSVQ